MDLELTKSVKLKIRISTLYLVFTESGRLDVIYEIEAPTPLAHDGTGKEARRLSLAYEDLPEKLARGLRGFCIDAVKNSLEPSED